MNKHYQAAKELIDALEADQPDLVVNGGLKAWLIAKANSMDQAITTDPKPTVAGLLAKARKIGNEFDTSAKGDWLLRMAFNAFADAIEAVANKESPIEVAKQLGKEINAYERGRRDALEWAATVVKECPGLMRNGPMSVMDLVRDIRCGPQAEGA